MIIMPWIILAGILSALALPPALMEKSWWRFFIALILSFVGIVLPLFVFLFSVFLVPEYKGACLHGWLDCFHLGKLALSPLVLLATAALYALEILRVKKRGKRWLVVGIFLGAIIASICFVFGLVCVGSESGLINLWLLVPFYTALWYSIRAAQLIRLAEFDFLTYLVATVFSLPCWLVSWLWSRDEYFQLPDQPPMGCFVVTAASHGHAQWVGPLLEINHNGFRRQANQQLITFWQFESLWCARFHDSHAAFRRVYNRLGPALAAQIKSPWLADAVYCLLKPAEWLAQLCLASKTNSPARSE